MAGAPPQLAEAEALLRETGGPGFAEPWQAEAFACTLALSRRGLFRWAEWVETFGAEIKANPARPGETDNAAYYRQWLAALETLLSQKGVASAAEIGMRQEAWRQAYLNTPHGRPVELAHATKPPAAAGPAADGNHGHAHDDHAYEPAHDHDHPHRHAAHAPPKPVAVSPARETGRAATPAPARAPFSSGSDPA